MSTADMRACLFTINLKYIHSWIQQAIYQVPNLNTVGKPLPSACIDCRNFVICMFKNVNSSYLRGHFFFSISNLDWCMVYCFVYQSAVISQSYMDNRQYFWCFSDTEGRYLRLWFSDKCQLLNSFDMLKDNQIIGYFIKLFQNSYNCLLNKTTGLF